MKLSLNFQFTNLVGQPVEGDTASKVVANILAQKADGIPPIKAYDWALKLFNEGEIEIDKSDFTLLKGFIEKSDLVVFAKAQILNAINERKEKEGE
jgi:hypothetical protein